MKAKFIRHLQAQLSQELPGQSAQKEMMGQALARRADQESRFKLPKKYKEAATLLLLYVHEGEWHTALMQRPDSPFPHSKQISFPGGGLETFDAGPAAAALRETEEEFGVLSETVELLGEMTSLYIPVSNYLVYPFVGYLEERPNFIPDAEEVEEIIEIPLAELLDMDNRKRKDIQTYNGSVLPNMPYFDLCGKTVWGATAMMLSEFVAVCKTLAKKAA
ncbi:CoA pyrophosphatase [Saprospira sp. CCB-QB6]|uniref:NUDIX hydrolase n=1 Tax=Saprospira sp. CCB-QB6 TaxID=3023936 RepID=UPI00234AF670|nr:CoA pyrophosphatase [Saprospira sp. CCB-QB6]WCL80683.1 CoA pyrophosphatase [Saprospira sp. CCB-QB6]